MLEDCFNNVLLQIRSLKRWIIIGFIFCILVFVFVFRLIATAEKWATFFSATNGILTSQPLYGVPDTFAYSSNPSRVAIAFLPVIILTFRWEWAFICITSLITMVVRVLKWRFGPPKPSIALVSLSTFYRLLHNHIDAIILPSVLFPHYWVGLILLAKPRVTIGTRVRIPPILSC